MVLYPIFCYSVGILLGTQIGKEMNPNYNYLINKYNKVNTEYYKNHQMNYRLNR
jgi:hypothetical protein